MAQVRLELARRSDEAIQALAQTHVAEMAGNANFPAPTPAIAAFAAVLDDYSAKLLASDQAASAALEATQRKDAARAALSQALSDRGNYVQTASGGDEAKILSSGFGVRAQPQPVGPLPAPIDFMPTMGDVPGQIDLTWSGLKGARTYVVEYREQGATGAWAQKIGDQEPARRPRPDQWQDLHLPRGSHRCRASLGQRPGTGEKKRASPEGATDWVALEWAAPSGLDRSLALRPRALPWAGLGQAFGLHPHPPQRCCPDFLHSL